MIKPSIKKGAELHDYEVEVEVNGELVTKRVWATDRTDAMSYVKNVLRHCHPDVQRAHRVVAAKVTPEVTHAAAS
jgi:hypothetical protein